MPDLIKQLTTAWNELCDAEETAPETSRLPIWMTRESALAPYPTLRSIEHGTEDNDAVLGALVRLAQGDDAHPGDTLAARVVLQRMMGAIHQLSARLSQRMPARDAQGEVVATMWEQILALSVPTGRTKIAANLKLNTHHVLSPKSKANQTKSNAEIPLPSTAHAWNTRPLLMPEPRIPLTVIGENDHCIGTLADMLDWANKNEILTTEEVALLRSAYVESNEDVGQAVKALALANGVSPNAINVRMSRAKKRLVQAIEDHGLVLAAA